MDGQPVAAIWPATVACSWFHLGIELSSVFGCSIRLHLDCFGKGRVKVTSGRSVCK